MQLVTVTIVRDTGEGFGMTVAGIEGEDVLVGAQGVMVADIVAGGACSRSEHVMWVVVNERKGVGDRGEGKGKNKKKKKKSKRSTATEVVLVSSCVLLLLPLFCFAGSAIRLSTLTG